MEEDTILVRFDLGGNFEESQDDRRGLSQRQRGMLQRRGPQGMVQDVGGTREEQPQRVGEKGRRRGPITAPVNFDRLDSVFARAPGTIELFIQHRRGGGIK